MELFLRWICIHLHGVLAPWYFFQIGIFSELVFYVEDKWGDEIFISPKRTNYCLIFRPHENKTYVAVGSMKTVMLNVSLFNAGDDAYETALHIRLPSGLYFIKILDLVSMENQSSVILYLFFFFFLL